MIKVSKYRVGQTWYLRYSKEIGLPRESLGTTDKKLAEDLRRVKEYSFLFGAQQLPVNRIKFSDFVSRFLLYKRGQGKAHSTVETYRYALNNFGKTLKLDLQLDMVTLEMIESFAAERRVLKRTEKTIRNELITLVTAFKWAKRQQYITGNPCDQLELPKKTKYPPRYLTQEHYFKLMSAINDPTFREVVKFYLLTGIRRTEGTRLQFDKHVDEELGVIWVPQEKQKDFRSIPISKKLKPVLRKLKRRSKEGMVIPYLPDYLTRAFRLYSGRAGLPREITLHALRHTFATWLARAGVSLPLIQTLLGQSDPDSAKIYTHAYSEDIVSAMNKVKLPSRRN